MNATRAADGSPYSPIFIAIIVSIATFMEVLDTTITNVSLSHIAGTLAASRDESTWVLTSYLVANGIVLPLSGWLSGVLGRKRFFMLCIAGFTIASFACGAATSLEELIIFRLIQGLAGGGLQPVQQAIILDAFPPEKRGAVFGITGITLIAAPIIGPTLGGWITDNYSWRWIFFINVPVGAFALMMVNRVVVDPLHARAQGSKRIDFIGLGLIAIGLGCLQIVMDKGQQDDWFDSNFIISMATLSACALVGAVFWLLNQKDPIVELRLLKNRGFGLGIVLILATGFALYGSTALLPQMVQSQYGYNATLAGLVISPGGLVLIFLMPLVGKLVGRIQARYLIAFGMVMISTGMFYTARLTPQSDYDTFVLTRIMQVLGIPFLFIPVSTLAFSNIPKELSSKASALFSLGRNLGGSIGIALSISYMSRHAQVRQLTLSEHLVPGNAVYESTLMHVKNALMAHGATAIQAQHLALGRMYQELQHQAAILAYHDTYIFMGSILSCTALLTFFLPPNNPRGKAPADAPAAH